ncbi:hypothetical protein ATANTOWER_009036 [Ataeniobius toweri]|uniref:Secreted protein n=1 Tax=Ataeniobius toweri TaxID=208326 RepID=A0ABU7C0J3_9TELE|nr:hypothetical protein [Ataeniobius toweri]
MYFILISFIIILKDSMLLSLSSCIMRFSLVKTKQRKTGGENQTGQSSRSCLPLLPRTRSYFSLKILCKYGPRSAEGIIRADLFSIQELYMSRVRKRASNIAADAQIQTLHICTNSAM